LGGPSAPAGTDEARCGRDIRWKTKIYILLGSGYTVERVAMIAEVTCLIERKAILELLLNSYRLKHRAIRVLLSARW